MRTRVEKENESKLRKEVWDFEVTLGLGRLPALELEGYYVYSRPTTRHGYRVGEGEYYDRRSRSYGSPKNEIPLEEALATITPEIMFAVSQQITAKIAKGFQDLLVGGGE